MNQFQLTTPSLPDRLAVQNNPLIHHQLFSKISILLLGAVITFSLFVFMAQLVKSDAVFVSEPSALPVLDFIQKPQEPLKPIKKIRVQPPKVMPLVERNPIPINKTNGDEIMQSFTPEALPPVKENFTRGYNDGEAMPVVQVSPQYPMTAAKEGKEGYVIVMFDIDTRGGVINAQVLEAQPKRLFNRSAIQAINNWKYKPKTVAGKSVVQRNQKVRLDFTLDQVQ